MIPQSVTNYFITMIIIGIVVPIAISAIYILVKKEKVLSVVAGAGSFFVFAIILESIPKAVLLQIPSPLSRFIMGNVWVFSLTGAFLAGMFEETGRFLTFKYVLKNRNTKTTGIAYGLGHGLFEVMFIFAYSGLQYITYIALINSGSFNDIIAQAAVISPAQAEALSALPAQLKAVSFATLPLALIERTFAVLFHVGASVIVYYSVKNKGKAWLYPVAILLHTLLDIIAGLGQTGVLTNVYVIECLIGIFSVAVFAGSYILLYKRMPENIECSAPAQNEIIE